MYLDRWCVIWKTSHTDSFALADSLDVLLLSDWTSFSCSSNSVKVGFSFSKPEGGVFVLLVLIRGILRKAQVVAL